MTSTGRDDHFARFVERANQLASTDYGAFLDWVNAFSAPRNYEFECSDPFSDDYRKAVERDYLCVAGLHEYVPEEHELAKFTDVDAPVSRQFPYSSGDLPTIGRYLMGIGQVVGQVRAPKGGRVIEYGAGWGHMSFALADAGLDVVCVDIEPGFVELVNRRAARVGAKVRAFHGRFGERPDGEAAVDAVIFYEAFHHALDHAEVLRRVRASLKPGGRLLLAGEPFYPSFPLPWGLRMDGHAVWAIRNFKWMELGFSADYIIALLIRLGFNVSVSNLREAGPLGLLYMADKPAGRSELGGLTFPPTDMATFAARANDGILFATDASTLTIADMAGHASVDVTLRNDLPIPVNGSVALAGAHEQVMVPAGAALTVKLAMFDQCGPLRISSEQHRPADLHGAGNDERLLGLRVEALSYDVD